MLDYMLQVKMHSLEILNFLSKVCDNNNLRYYMIGGTLLGAIRHKGFIPWDDDIDVAMPRKDYEYLLKNADQIFTGGIYPYHYTNDNDTDMILKLVNKNISIKYMRNDEIVETNIGIDIFPIDGTPDNNFLRKLHFFKLMLYRCIYKFTCSENLEIETQDRKGYEKILVKLSKKINIGRLINRKSALLRLEKLLKKYDCDKSRIMAGTFLGAYKLREFADVKYFRERIKYKFEDYEFYGTNEADGYLKCIYGNYMELPPEEKRVGRHKIISIEVKK